MIWENKLYGVWNVKVVVALREIDVVDWLSRSYDLNPIENVWGILVHQVHKDNKQNSCLAELRQAIRRAWNHLKFDTLLELTISMSSRIFDWIGYWNIFLKFNVYFFV